MSLSKRHAAIVNSIIIAIAIGGLTPDSNADIIHESATMGPVDQWPGPPWIFEYQFLGSRFEITEPTEITAIGGHIGSENDRHIFGAIVSLDNQNDFPSDTAWQNNLVEWIYFRPNWMSGDLRIPLNVILQPGWYGLVFGAGEFGLTNTAVAFMPTGGQSSYPGSSYFHWIDDGFSPKWYNTLYGSGYPRFVVEGHPYIPPVEIYGSKFNDVDGDGVWDAGEPNMPGWEIYLDENGNGIYDASEPNTVTDSGGMYRFTDIDTPVTYRVREVMKDGWTQTMPGGSDNEYVVFAEPNNTYGPYDFGNTDQPVQTGIKLYGYVKTVNDDPVSNARVEIDAGSTSSGFDYTDELGYYEITADPPFTGSISVTEANWQQDTASLVHTNLATDFQEDFVVLYLYGGGDGLSDNPYQIWTPEQMNQIGYHQEHWDAHFILMDDINMSAYAGMTYRIIGTSSADPFRGNFNGNNHTISDFTYDSVGVVPVGLFGVINSSTAVLRDVTLSNPRVTVNSVSTLASAGILAGSLASGVITNCRITGGEISGICTMGSLVGSVGSGTQLQDSDAECSVSGRYNAGGLAGRNDGTIDNCQFNGDVSGFVDIGGITGFNTGTISHCSSDGTVTVLWTNGTRHRAGGLVGENRGMIRYSNSSAFVSGAERMGGLVGDNYFADIVECYATGDVSGSIRLGGLVGYNHMSGVVNCYARGNVTGSGNAAVIGGLLGYNDHSYGTSRKIENSYATGVVSGSANVGGLLGYDYNSAGNFENCIWNSTANPALPGIGNATNPEVMGETSSNMTLEPTFTSNDWDFAQEAVNGTEDIWHMPYAAVGFPRLWWQRDIPGDWVGKYGVGVEDYAVLAGSWMNIDAEINLSGPDIIDFEDLAVFLGNWCAGR